MADYSTNSGSRGVAELERDVDEERNRVSETIDALQSKASVSNIVDQIVKAVTENGGQVSRNLGRSLRDNPLPAILTGVGLIWLMSGSGTRSAYRGDDTWDEDDEDYYYRGYSGLPGSTQQPTSEATGTYSAEEVVWRDDAGSQDIGDDRPALGQRASEALGNVRDRASEAVGDVRNRAADTLDSARERVSGVAETARSRLSHTGHAVRDAGDAARRRSRAVRYRASRAGHDAREGLDSAMYEQPLVLGALALAVGAAIGGALPRSRTEDRMFGEQADRARQSARAMAEEQGRKVAATAGAVADEARTIAGEALSEAGGRMPSATDAVHETERRVRDAAERLKQAGTAEAERQNLTQPGTAE